MKHDEGRLLVFMCFFLSLLIYIALGYFTNRADFTQLYFLYSSAFVVYMIWHRQSAKHSILNETLAAAMVLRLSLLFYLPNLSDDFYRFVWDGRLSAQGINPFHYLPSSLINSSIANVDTAIFEKLNSPEYYTIYPPLNQLVFYLSAVISPSNLLGSVIVMKVFIVACELGTILVGRKLLKQFGLNENLILLYALNPLVIMELSGNIHFEAAMIFFTVLAVYLMVKNKVWLSAAAFSVAVCTKFWPLMFIPFFYKRFFRTENRDSFPGMIRFAIWTTSIILLTGIFFLPFLSLDMIANIGSSINLYFQHFEFNASVFYIIRWIGFQTHGYDVIRIVGPWLPIVVAGILVVCFLLESKPLLSNIFHSFLFSLTIYLMFATIVHPWYATPLVLFCIFTRFRFPVVWSALIPLSYFAYSAVPASENGWLIGLEYLTVGVIAAFELLKTNSVTQSVGLNLKHGNL